MEDSARLSVLYQKRKARLDKPGYAANIEALQKEIDELEQRIKAAEQEQGE